VAESNGVDAVILCGGLGLRLRPLTEKVPKALVPVNHVPLLDIHLRALQASGVRKVTCVVGHLGEQVRKFAGDGRRYDLELRYANQEHPLGTGDAVLAAARSIRSEMFGVIYADTYFSHLSQLWTNLISTPNAKIVCAEVDDAGAYGRIVLRTGIGIPILERVIEKDGHHRAGLVNAGMYFLPKEVLSILSSQALSPRGERELPFAVEQLSRRGTDVSVIRTDDWVDIGSWEGLAAAERLALGSLAR